MDELGITGVVLPELDALRGVAQTANHHLDVHDHTLAVLERLLEVEADLPRYAGDAAPDVAELLAEPLADEVTRGCALRFGALLHDIGKPATRAMHDGRVTFIGHDSAGAEVIAGDLRPAEDEHEAERAPPGPRAPPPAPRLHGPRAPARAAARSTPTCGRPSRSPPTSRC